MGRWNIFTLFLAFTWTLVETQVRKPRSVGLTNGGRINIGVQFILPITITLPMVSGRWRRSIEPSLPVDENEYGIDPWHGNYLKKLDSYFYHLNVDEEVCRQRLLCEMAADPALYQPLSELILAKISPDSEILQVESALPRMRAYEMAAIVGAVNGTCEQRYLDCGGGPSELLNLQALRIWQDVSDYLHINMYEELDT